MLYMIVICCRLHQGVRINGLKVLEYGELALQVATSDMDVLRAFECKLMPRVAAALSLSFNIKYSSSSSTTYPSPPSL